MRDGSHSWSCTHLLGGNSNIKGGHRRSVALAFLLSPLLALWNYGVLIPVRLGGVGVAQDFAPPLVMWQYRLSFLDMLLLRSCGAGLRFGVS